MSHEPEETDMTDKLPPELRAMKAAMDMVFEALVPSAKLDKNAAAQDAKPPGAEVNLPASAAPSYWDEKSKERREEFKQQDAEDRERAYPDPEWRHK